MAAYNHAYLKLRQEFVVKHEHNFTLQNVYSKERYVKQEWNKHMVQIRKSEMKHLKEIYCKSNKNY